MSETNENIVKISPDDQAVINAATALKNPTDNRIPIRDLRIVALENELKGTKEGAQALTKAQQEMGIKTPTGTANIFLKKAKIATIETAGTLGATISGGAIGAGIVGIAEPFALIAGKLPFEAFAPLLGAGSVAGAAAGLAAGIKIGIDDYRQRVSTLKR